MIDVKIIIILPAYEPQSSRGSANFLSPLSPSHQDSRTKVNSLFYGSVIQLAQRMALQPASGLPRQFFLENYSSSKGSVSAFLGRRIVHVSDK